MISLQLWIEDEHINVTNGDRLGLVKLNNTFPIPFMFNPQIGGDLWFRRLNSDSDIPRVAKEYVFEELSFPYHFSITVTFKPDISDFYSRYIDKLSKEDSNMSDYKDSDDYDSINGFSPQNGVGESDYNDIKGGEGVSSSVDYKANSKHENNAEYGDTKYSKKENKLVKGLNGRSFVNRVTDERPFTDQSLLTEKSKGPSDQGDDPKTNSIHSSNKMQKHDSSKSKQDISQSDNDIRKSTQPPFKFQRLNALSNASQRLLQNASLPRSNDLSRYFTFSESGDETQEQTTEKEEEFTSIDNITDVQGAANIGLEKVKQDSDNYVPSNPKIITHSIDKQLKQTLDSGKTSSESGDTHDLDNIKTVQTDNDDITISDDLIPHNRVAATLYSDTDSISSKHPTTSYPNAQPLQSPEYQSVDHEKDTTSPFNLVTLNQPSSIISESSTLPSNQIANKPTSDQSERSIKNKIDFSGVSDHSSNNIPTQSLGVSPKTVEGTEKSDKSSR